LRRRGRCRRASATGWTLGRRTPVTNLRARAWLLPSVAALLFSGSYIAAKVATRELGPFSATLLRYVVALVLLAALLRRVEAPARLPRKADVGYLVLLGLLGIAAYHVLFFTALRFTEVGNTAIVNATSPVVTALMAAAVIKERLRGREYAGVGVAVAGVLLLLSRGRPDLAVQMNVNVGDALMMLSVLSWAGYSLLVRRLSARYASVTLTFWASVAGVVLLIPLALAEGLPRAVARASPATWLAVGYMGIAASAVGYVLYNRSIAAIGPTRTASVVYSVVPVLVTILAWLTLGEPVTGIMVASTALILVGLHLALGRAGRAPAVQGPPRGEPSAG